MQTSGAWGQKMSLAAKHTALMIYKLKRLELTDLGSVEQWFLGQHKIPDAPGESHDEQCQLMSNATERSKIINVAMPVGVESRWLAMFHKAISMLWKILKLERNMFLRNRKPSPKFYFSFSASETAKNNFF